MLACKFDLGHLFRIGPSKKLLLGFWTTLIILECSRPVCKFCHECCSVYLDVKKVNVISINSYITLKGEKVIIKLIAQGSR